MCTGMHQLYHTNPLLDTTAYAASAICPPETSLSSSTTLAMVVSFYNDIH